MECSSSRFDADCWARDHPCESSAEASSLPCIHQGLRRMHEAVLAHRSPSASEHLGVGCSRRDEPATSGRSVHLAVSGDRSRSSSSQLESPSALESLRARAILLCDWRFCPLGRKLNATCWQDHGNRWHFLGARIAIAAAPAWTTHGTVPLRCRRIGEDSLCGSEHRWVASDQTRNPKGVEEDRVGRGRSRPQCVNVFGHRARQRSCTAGQPG